MVVQNTQPSLAVEWYAMFAGYPLRLVDILHRDRLEQVLSEIRLQSDYEMRGIGTSTRLYIARHILGAWRVKDMVGVLVTVRVENDVPEVRYICHVRISFLYYSIDLVY